MKKYQICILEVTFHLQTSIALLNDTRATPLEEKSDGATRVSRSPVLSLDYVQRHPPVTSAPVPVPDRPAANSSTLGLEHIQWKHPLLGAALACLCLITVGANTVISRVCMNTGLT